MNPFNPCDDSASNGCGTRLGEGYSSQQGHPRGTGLGVLIYEDRCLIDGLNVGLCDDVGGFSQGKDPPLMKKKDVLAEF